MRIWTLISICDYCDSMITQISNIDLSSQPSRHFAHALARNNIVPPSSRQIKFVDAQRFDLPLLQNRRWIRFLPLACLCYIVQVCSDKRVTRDGMAEKAEKPGKMFFRADDTNIAPKERFNLMSINRIIGFFRLWPVLSPSADHRYLFLFFFFRIFAVSLFLSPFFLRCVTNRIHHKPRAGRRGLAAGRARMLILI